MTKRHFNTFLFILIAFILITSYVAARGTIAERTENVNKIIVPLTSKGYEMNLDRAMTGVLDKGRSINYMVPLYRGVHYVIVAAGDETSQDIDIQLRDEGGKLIASDSSSSSRSSIKISPKWTGAFFVNVKMSQCRDSDAYYISLYGYKED